MLLARKTFTRLFAKDRLFVLNPGEFLAFHGWGKDAGWWYGSPRQKGVQRLLLDDHTRMTQLSTDHVSTWPKALRRIAVMICNDLGKAKVTVASRIRPGLAEIPPAVRRALNSPYTPAAFRGLPGLNICWALDYIPTDAYEWFVAAEWLRMPNPASGRQEKYRDMARWRSKQTKAQRRAFLARLREPRAKVLEALYGTPNVDFLRAPSEFRTVAKWLGKRQRWLSGTNRLYRADLGHLLLPWQQHMGTRPTPQQLACMHRIVDFDFLLNHRNNDEYVQLVLQVVSRLAEQRVEPDRYHERWDSVGLLTRHNYPELVRRIRTWEDMERVHQQITARAREEWFRANRVERAKRWEEVEDQTLPPYQPLIPGITQLRTEEEFQDEGLKMHHCVGGYYGDSRRGRATFYHLEVEGEKATLQLFADGQVGQFYGPCNQRPAKVLEALLDKWYVSPPGYGDTEPDDDRDIVF